MSNTAKRFGLTFGELRRRRVPQAAFIYLTASFAAIEVTDILTPSLSLPDRAVTIMFALAIVGFPIAMFVSWRFDLTTAGFRRTEDVPFKASRPEQTQSAIEAPPRSIAVLPFANMSEDPNNEYFSDGVTEEIINALAQISDLHVAARTSSFAFKDQPENVQTIGQRLNVASVLEGSVRRSGTEIRITAQLVNCRDGFHIWSHNYDREMKDVFAIQDEIANAIADHLKVELLREDRPSFVKRQTRDVEAYHHYLKGRFAWNRRTAKDLSASIDLFQAAIAADPGYALAYAGLADTYSLMGWYRHLPPQEAFERTKWAATRAIEIDATLAEAHTSLAYACFLYDWNWEGAESEFQQAIELNPRYGTALHWYAEFLMAMNRVGEAKVQLARASEVDPLSLSVATGIGWASYFEGDFEAAIKQYETILAINPDFVIVPWFLGPAYVQAGEYDRAINLYDEWAGRLARAPELRVMRAHAQAAAGEHGRARRLLSTLELSDENRVPPDNLAWVYVALGEFDRALDLLDDAYAQHCWPLVFAAAEPAYASLRSEPRFIAMLDRMDLAV